ncbi:MAG: tyrosine-type recombinase/integrase [Eubacterium sp.]|nr:tyrosine-type recombinase/integrase [Eubacterium sp.]
MKLPNGYGSVVKLSGNRRRPYAVRKTLGFDDRGYPIYSYIGYTETRQEGLMLLAEYNRNPYDVDAKKITLSELFDRWLELKAPKLPQTTVSPLKSARKHVTTLDDIPYCQIEAYMMQDCIDSVNLSKASKNNIKNLFYHLDRLARELKIVSSGSSDLLTCKSDKEKKEKLPFSYSEVEKVWEYIDYPHMDTVAVLLYTGLRIQEFLTLKTANIDFDNGFFKGGVKTAAGKNRTIPIHPQIMPLMENLYHSDSEYLFAPNGAVKALSRSKYIPFWNNCMQTLDTTHTPHDCRHSFRSELDRKKANKVCIDRLMGHSSGGVGETTYTHKTLAELTAAINLITYAA